MTANTLHQAPPIAYAIVGGKTLTFQSAEQKFAALSHEWDKAHLGLSTTNYHHPAHLQIIGMGTQAVPHLLDRLRTGERRWIFALRCIAGEQPDATEVRGDAERVIQAWLDWADQRGWSHGRLI